MRKEYNPPVCKIYYMGNAGLLVGTTVTPLEVNAGKVGEDGDFEPPTTDNEVDYFD